MNDFTHIRWALVVPMANEEPDFRAFTEALISTLDVTGSGHVFLVVDQVSKDQTLELCMELSLLDQRFTTCWAPENRNVVDAYMKGYREAAASGYEFVIEMDAGLSHDPAQIPLFLDAYLWGYDCVFGSRFTNDSPRMVSNLFRFILSRFGTACSNLFLATKLSDMTSGFQGFGREVVLKFLDYQLKSKAHFYQTELRYLLRKRKYTEIAVSYKAPSPSVSLKSLMNSLFLLLYYSGRRLLFKKDII